MKIKLSKLKQIIQEERSLNETHDPETTRSLVDQLEVAIDELLDTALESTDPMSSKYGSDAWHRAGHVVEDLLAQLRKTLEI